ncbi:MAG: Mur ligase family protein, partial [Candidatus Bipolaricaulis sp.]|nr:Mur ligase family protein [Candidatus Bipolaricaulis sp.]
VVGSFGKTTAAHAVSRALALKSPEGWNSKSYLAASVLRLRPWVRRAVIEVGISRPGQMVEYARIVRPDVVVVTSIGSEHGSSLVTLDVTRNEKAEMVRALPPDGVAVLYGDDENVRWMAGETAARVVTFGLGEPNDVRASDVRLDWPFGIAFVLHADGEAREVRTRLVGRHQVCALLAAVAVGRSEGLTLDAMVSRLEALPPATGRLELLHGPSGSWVLLDARKSHLETVEAALDLLEEVPARRILVLGSVEEPPGSQGPIYRTLGARAARIAPHVLFVGETKEFKSLRVGARRAGGDVSAFELFRDVAGVPARLRTLLKPGDVVLVKGRSTQHLERVAVGLLGEGAACSLRVCRARWFCQECPALRGENRRRGGR